MLFSRFAPLVWAVLGSASPAPLDVALNAPENELIVRDALEQTMHTRHLEKRLSADFSMAKTWGKNEMLFSGSWINNDGAGMAEGVSLAIVCVECYTKGTVTAKLTDEEIINPKVTLSFAGVEAYVDLGIAVSSGAMYTVNLFTSQSPIGLGFPGLSVGVVFYVDLVFSLSEELDLEGGFYVKLADDAYLETSVFDGVVTDSFFDGLTSKSLPVTVKKGTATFKADLRVRVQCGAEADLDIFGIGAGAVVGIYANLIEFVAVLEKTPTCSLQSREWWDLNVGAYAHLDVVVDYKTIGPVPTVSTTLLSAPTLTQCWINGPGGSPVETGGVGVTVSPPPAHAGSSITTLTTLTKPYSVTTSFPALSPPPLGTGHGSGSLSTTTFKYPITNTSTPSATGTDDLVTSTLYTTTTYTITSCAASVVNCPASYQQEIIVTQTVDLYTTVCPVTASVTAIPTSLDLATTSSFEAVKPNVVHVITDVVVLVPCETPVVETFVAPSSVVAPAEHHITAVAITTDSVTIPSPAAAPFIGGAEGVKQVQVSSADAASTHGTGKPSASYSQNPQPSGKTPPVTAGSGRAAGSFMAVILGIVGAVMLPL